MIRDIPENWRDALTNYVGRDEWESAINKIDGFLQTERRDERAYHPLEENIFKAFDKTDFNDVRVVIIGQDPYPDENKATGVAFSMPIPDIVPAPDGEIVLSSSIESIYTAIENDNVGFTRPNHGNLERWADQGVLLLNRVLTFHKCDGCNKNIHKNKGWEQFTQAVVKALSNDNTRQLHFILWGNEAQELKKYINGRCYHIHAAPHPTSRNEHLEAFQNCQHFSAVNNIFNARDEEPINWIIPPAVPN